MTHIQLLRHLGVSALAVSIAATPALAHATLEQQEAAVGSTYKAVMRIGHGCEGEATQKVTITIPEGVIAVKPMPKANWSLEVKKGAYAQAYDYYGTKLTEGVTSISWIGNLSDAHYDEFVFRAKLSDALSADSTIYFPTVQTCANATEDWVNIPTPGQDGHDIEGPAPALHLTADHDHGHSH
ncbi:DUF1775 domain-containing protein [Rhodobacteraceae bacterium F11138]|nr:DUF1775 domain-containing protein [Rhodobacteraceae bacterium F11138]